MAFTKEDKKEKKDRKKKKGEKEVAIPVFKRGFKSFLSDNEIKALFILFI